MNNYPQPKPGTKSAEYVKALSQRFLDGEALYTFCGGYKPVTIVNDTETLLYPEFCGNYRTKYIHAAVAPITKAWQVTATGWTDYFYGRKQTTIAFVHWPAVMSVIDQYPVLCEPYMADSPKDMEDFFSNVWMADTTQQTEEEAKDRVALLGLLLGYPEHAAAFFSDHVFVSGWDNPNWSFCTVPTAIACTKYTNDTKVSFACDGRYPEKNSDFTREADLVLNRYLAFRHQYTHDGVVDTSSLANALKRVPLHHRWHWDVEDMIEESGFWRHIDNGNDVLSYERLKPNVGK